VSAHTPGTWAWSEDGHDLRPTDESKGAVVVIATTDGMLVRSYNRNGIEASMAEVDANKQLIGASPDMLAALILARDALRIWAPKDAHLEQIDAAIAKATASNPT
jgi:hypothetical protein